MANDGSIPASTTRVLLVCGLPGAGKTRLARALAEALGWARVSRDDLCWQAGEAPRDFDPQIAKSAAFAHLIEALGATLSRGAGVIVEGMPFSRQRERDAVALVARRHGVEVLTLWLDCPPALARRRIDEDLARGAHPATDRIPALVDAVASRWEVPEDAVRLDAGQAPESLRDQALAALRSRLRRT